MIDLPLEPLRTIFVTVVLCLTRLTVASMTVPFLGGESIQLSVRASIVFSLGVILIPMIAPTLPHEHVPALVLTGLFVKEAMLGLLIGYLASKAFWIALGIGMVVDNQRGATIAESLDPSSNEQVSPMGQFLQQTLIALFYTGGGFLLFLTTVFETYRSWPVVSFYPQLAGDFPGFFLGQLDEIMTLTVVLAAPMLITLFLSELGLGFINRFAPQLNVFFLAMPIKSLVAFVVLIFYLPYLVHIMSEDAARAEQALNLLKAVVN